MTAFACALVVADHDGESIHSTTRHAVTAASQCGDDVHVLVAGDGCAEAARAAAAIAGVSRVLHADAPSLANGLAENHASLVRALAQGYSHIFFSTSSHGKNVAPRVAALLDVAQVSDIIRVLDAHTFERPVYAGNAIATVRSGDAIKVATVRATGFPAAPAEGGTASIESVAPVGDTGLSAFVSRAAARTDRPDLGSARVVVSGGRALGSEETFLNVLVPLADKLGGALGASRAAVDAGYAPNDWQVGQTGKIVAPELYIACGISGAIQHQAGMKDSKVIVAINKDPDAPIFDIADYGLVADLFDAVPQLVASL